MKKILFSLLLLSTFWGHAQYTLIPDVNFEKALISLRIDSGAVDGMVLTANISGITSLNIAANDIINLTGIQDFVNLISLECSRNKLTSLDVTKNKALKSLNCWGNNLTSLDITNNTALTYLSCFQNQLTSLDVSKNTVLDNLYCSLNQLTSLNLKNGNNKNLFGLNMWSNPNLTCILVDNAAYSNSNWAPSSKDATASYSENCDKTAAIAPPSIKAEGYDVYCPQTYQKIAKNVIITHDPSETSTNAVYIQIASGYIIGQDLLQLSNDYRLNNPSITSTFIASEGKLKIFNSSGNLTNYSDLKNAIEAVEFYSSSASPSGTRSFSISIGNGQISYLPSNGHYYEYVSSYGISWTAARDAAAIKKHYELQGYLATLTTKEEAQLAGAQAPGTGWIGGTDQQNENNWRWVTGPEGIENGGMGRLFWLGGPNGNTIAPDSYANWNNNEPNNNIQPFKPNGEHYAHITAPGIGKPGAWNDLSNDGDPPGNYHPKGYIVEYGGMPGDPTLQLSASTTLSMAKITSTTAATRCGNGTVTLLANAENGIVNWYDSPTAITPIATGNSFTTAILTSNTTYYVDAGCINERKPVIATINPLPIVNDITIFQCDTDLIPDGKTLFNLTVKNDVISDNYNNEIFTYYTTLNGANNGLASDLITNPLAFENTTSTNMNIWAREANKLTGCFSVSKISLIVSATNIATNYKIIVPAVCDDLLDINGNNNINNNNRDGITSFDLSSTKATIQALLPTTEVYNINYYRNEADALAEINSITDITNYRNIGYPNTQDIWIRIDSQIENACFGLGPYISLKVEALPLANTVNIPRECDDNNDGIFTFNTANLESDLLKGQTNVTVTYFDSNDAPLKDANGVLISSPFPSVFITTSQVIKAVVTNNTPTQCYDETKIEFIVDKTPQAFPIAPTLTTTCDDEINPLEQDGKYAFNTSGFDTTILGGQSGMIVKYYDQNGTSLPSPLPNPFVTGTQTITATVENPNNINCTASTTIQFVVHPLPNIDINLNGSANQLVCSNLTTFYVTLDAGIADNTPTSDYNYIWKKDGVDLGFNTPTIDVNEIGNYTVEVINSIGCSRTRTINVNASNIATIASIDIVELSDENSITVNVTGPGDYEFSLDDATNFWQDSNLFNNVPAGIHEIFINDKNGCGVVSKTVIVVGIPKYFTPNNDSYNDFWGIKGMTKYPNAYVQIFNRYGKLIKFLNNANPNWDGTFNGALLPADDYWYVIKLEEGKPEIHGHFSLKR